MFNDALLSNSEKISFALREVFHSHGFRPYRMSKFEEYDFYAKNKDFLLSDNVITFTDANGKLMALKPDVTLSIIKNSPDDTQGTERVYYSENVYRISNETGAFREITQSGVECFGQVTEEDVTQVIGMAVESLSILSEDAILALSSLDLLHRAIEQTQIRPDKIPSLLEAVSACNLHEIDALCPESEARETLKKLVSLHGSPEEVLPQLAAWNLGEEAVSFAAVATQLDRTYPGKIRLDFSVTDDMNYYNGMVFKGFVRGIPLPVLSGGCYDRLMQKMGRKANAIGFAVYVDLLERLTIGENREGPEDDFLNIALPKGRLGEKVYALFAKAGFDCPSILEENRKLVFENPEKKLRYFWVKPSDVSIYVERGAADIGVAGKDILEEYSPDVYELLDLGLGKCRMVVAGPEGWREDTEKRLRVATKFPNAANRFYQARGRDIDIIKLNGSIEIAPILGLSDVIVDIVETGTTLKENHLQVCETVFPISARLIANKSTFKFKNKEIELVAGELAKLIG